MAGDGQVEEPAALNFVQQENSKLVVMKKDERGDFCKKFQNARRRRQEMRRLRCDAEAAAAAKRIRNMKDTSSTTPYSSPSSSSSSPQSTTTSRSAPSDSDGDGDATGEGEVGVMEPAAAGDVREGAAAHVSSPCASHGSVSIVGRRAEMEDAVTVVSGIGATMTSAYDFFGVYDGHGGAQVAEACRERMHVVLADVVGGDWPEGGQARWMAVMGECFARVDEEVAEGLGAEAPEKTVGSTAVVAVVGPTQIVVANCGDSRAVLSRGGIAVPLSSDHKPDRPDEMERVEAAGGRVINWGGYRVLGVLGTSRSIGDYYLKPFVTSEPEVTVTNRTENDEFIILASDGLWDVISSEVACRITRQCLSGRAARIFPQAISGSSAAEAAAFLTELAMSRGSRDNISVIVVELKRLSSETVQ